nr:MAG TPA: hypothetical protein [Caudoviricetes sp.]
MLVGKVPKAFVYHEAPLRRSCFGGTLLGGRYRMF